MYLIILKSLYNLLLCLFVPLNPSLQSPLTVNKPQYMTVTKLLLLNHYIPTLWNGKCLRNITSFYHWSPTIWSQASGRCLCRFLVTSIRSWLTFCLWIYWIKNCPGIWLLNTTAWEILPYLWTQLSDSYFFLCMLCLESKFGEIRWSSC